MLAQNRSQTAGFVGMLGAVFFFVGLLIEYRYDLFPPGSGTLYTVNQLHFFVAMGCIGVMLWAVRGEGVGGNGRFARIALTLFPIGWGLIILGGILDLLIGSTDNPLIPLGALLMVIFGLAAGIVVVLAHKWAGWHRYVLLLHGVILFIAGATRRHHFAGTDSGDGKRVDGDLVFGGAGVVAGIAVRSSTSSEKLNF